MSKTTVLDKIKNPDVPGFEASLPPPPPPPLTAKDAPVVIPKVEVTPNTVNLNNSNNLVSYPIPNQAYYPSLIAPPPPPQPDQPWWTPNETDSEIYTQWYENAYKAALQATTEKESSGKSKNKHFKKKQEVIDPKADAERVANAQKELSALMKPLKCDLCNAVMNSTLQAKLHYQGKPHQKKVSMYLNQSAKKIKTEDGQEVTSTTNDWNSYCEICKIWFTSMTDATQHYAGKKHMKAAFGTTKQKSKKPAINKTPIDPTGRYGIGTAFAPPQPEMPLQQAPPPPPPPEVPPAVVIPPIPHYNTPPVVAYPTPLRCDLCGISVNRQDQLDTHKRGAKHMKMLKLHGLATPQSDTATAPTQPPIDYSIYRTPSGQYYCAPCNLSLNSEAVFAQHVQSKKHKSQVNPKQPASSQSGPAAKRMKKEVKTK